MHWYRNEINNQKAMNFLMARSKNLILRNSRLDLRKSEEMLEANSILKNLTLTESEFYAPLLYDGDSYPIQLKHFNGNIESLSSSSPEIYSSLESMTINNRTAGSVLAKFLK